MMISDTFGGENLFNLVKSPKQKSLVCRYLFDYCDGLIGSLNARIQEHT